MLSSKQPLYQSVEDDHSSDDVGKDEAVKAGTPSHPSVAEIIAVQDSTGFSQGSLSYQSDRDPSIYALLHKQKQIYTNAISTNSLVAKKETVTPIYHCNPYLEIVAIVLVVLIGWVSLLMYYLPNPPLDDPTDLSFPVVLGIAIFLGLDIFLQLRITCNNPKFPIHRYIVNCLVHHTASIMVLCATLITGEDRFYKWAFLLLTVELNTAFLKLRRIVNRKTIEFKYVNYAFYITWFGIRVIFFPCFTVYIWIVYITEEPYNYWVLVGCINITILTILYAIWTYNLMDKKTRKTKLGKKVAQVAIA